LSVDKWDASVLLFQSYQLNGTMQTL